MTPDQIATVRAARRQALAAVSALCSSIRLHVASKDMARAIGLFRQACEEFGGVAACWPAQDESDRQRVEQVRQQLIAVETVLMVAAQGTR